MPATARSADGGAAAGAAWHIVTCEYPPALGGIADFTHVMAEGLGRAGEHVHVWAPPPAQSRGGVTVHEVAGGYRRRALASLDAAVEACPPPRRLFVQWVPHGYGYKSLNLPFCLWVRRRAARGDQVDLMVHEPFLPFDPTRLRQNAGAIVHRAMLAILLSAARRVWVSTPSYIPRIRPWAFGRPVPVDWLSVPSPVAPARAADVQAVRDGFGEAPIVGYFGTANPLVAGVLGEALAAIARDRPGARFLLAGTGTDRFARHQIDAGALPSASILRSGPQPAAELSRLLACCDVFVQPYHDGVSARRTTLMALLLQGSAVVTNVGSSTEPFWEAAGALRLVAGLRGADLGAAAVALLENQAERQRLAAAARALYAERFEPSRAVARLLGRPVVPVEACVP